MDNKDLVTLAVDITTEVLEHLPHDVDTSIVALGGIIVTGIISSIYCATH